MIMKYDDDLREGINAALNIDNELCQKLQENIFRSVGNQTSPMLGMQLMLACMMVAAKIGAAYSYPERRRFLAFVVREMKKFFAWQDSVLKHKPPHNAHLQ